jgi:hypothetical protein
LSKISFLSANPVCSRPLTNVEWIQVFSLIYGCVHKERWKLACCAKENLTLTINVKKARAGSITQWWNTCLTSIGPDFNPQNHKKRTFLFHIGSWMLIVPLYCHLVNNSRKKKKMDNQTPAFNASAGDHYLSLLLIIHLPK